MKRKAWPIVASWIVAVGLQWGLSWWLIATDGHPWLVAITMLMVGPTIGWAAAMSGLRIGGYFR